MEQQSTTALSTFATAAAAAQGTTTMMPQHSNASEQPSKIFINPKFTKAHINPMFLASNGALRRPVVQQDKAPPPQSKIHLNPAFLEKLRAQQVSPTITVAAASSTTLNITISVPKSPTVAVKHAMPQVVNPIIKNTRRKLVRATTMNDAQVAVMAKHVGKGTPSIVAPLVRIGKTKLVRSNIVVGLENVKPKTIGVLPERKSLRIDRRQPFARSPMQKPTFVKRYALSRINGITPKKVVITDPRLLKLKRHPTTKSSEKAGKSTVAYASKNKQLALVNINGVLYRSSTNKLQKSVPRSVDPSPSKAVRKTKEHYLIIRGMRFALDRTGMKLRSVADATPIARPSIRGIPEPRLNRIDIGGLTYKVRKDGTFVRTDNHKTRNHLSVAKQRSIQVLTSKLKKCNEPCHIYRRLGKCLAHQRGKCPKVHDPKHVSICQKFLRGECILDGCLLSHDVSLEKMPVCMFFLEGRCMHDVCPYLHKKVSEKERICAAFLNGFCPLADKCPNRHVFQCPEYERNGKCDRIKCPYPHGRKEAKWKNVILSTETKQTTPGVPQESKPTETTALPIRYYRDDGQSTANRGQTGEFSASERNQLQRMLGEVDKLKKRYKERDDLNIDRDDSETRQESCGDVEDPFVSIDVAVACDGKSSEACGGSQTKATPDVKMNDDHDDDESGDTRPPVLRRKALGILPAFIPI